MKNKHNREEENEIRNLESSHGRQCIVSQVVSLRNPSLNQIQDLIKNKKKIIYENAVITKTGYET